MDSEKIIDQLEDLDCELHNSQEIFKELLGNSAEDAFIKGFIQNLDNARLILRSAVQLLRSRG